MTIVMMSVDIVTAKLTLTERNVTVAKINSLDFQPAKHVNVTQLEQRQIPLAPQLESVFVRKVTLETSVINAPLDSLRSWKVKEDAKIVIVTCLVLWMKLVTLLENVPVMIH